MITPAEIDALTAYRDRLWAYIRGAAYKDDCGLIDIRWPSYSRSTFPLGEASERVTLHVRCYRAPSMDANPFVQDGRSYWFHGATLLDAVRDAAAALDGWEKASDV